MSQLSAQVVSTAEKPLRLLVVSESRDLPPVVQELIASRRVEAVRAGTFRDALDPARLAGVDAVLVCGPTGTDPGSGAGGDVQLLADALISHRLTGVVLSPGMSGVVPGGDAFIHVLPDVSADELWGRVATIRQYKPQLRQMEEQVSTMQRLGKKLNQHFVEVDRELHLASRLQRDFLPKSLPEVGDVRFAVLYRPATWVSGDTYDVCRLDETHVGFFVADAVGHGVAAGLLTMFIKQAIIGKRIDNDGYSIVPTSDVLAALNADLAGQELPNCQFVTACYATINVAAHELTFSRGGHPHPIHVGADGACREVRTVGGLLGVFPDERFPIIALSLEPAEKFIIYSDGLEDVIISRRQRNHSPVQFTPEFLEFVRNPAKACLDALSDRLDCAAGSLQPGDDQTCLIVERLPASAERQK